MFIDNGNSFKQVFDYCTLKITGKLFVQYIIKKSRPINFERDF
jgi:hypothetical protein